MEGNEVLPGPLAGKICLVAGASRGVGRGVARALGAAGATVICTGRSSEAGPRTDGRIESVEDTARIATMAGGQSGGTGHPYRCDHTSQREVDEMVAWALRRFGRLDACIIAVWGGNDGHDGTRNADGSLYGTPFWRRSTRMLESMVGTALTAQLLTARAVAPPMVTAKSGVLITISFDTSGGYLGDVYEDLAKAAMNRLSFALAQELAPHGVTALTLSPGFVRTERVLDAGQGGDATESPLYAGRACAALLADPHVARHAGLVLHAGDLAPLYGFQDEDGTQPARFDPFASAAPLFQP
jgi:NAD(P)-dependent dehydrogenase (short-subunit alcohol dehydrogenase family)